jgi:hypothetical protein
MFLTISVCVGFGQPAGYGAFTTVVVSPPPGTPAITGTIVIDR